VDGHAPIRCPSCNFFHDKVSAAEYDTYRAIYSSHPYRDSDPELTEEDNLLTVTVFVIIAVLLFCVIMTIIFGGI